MAHRRTWGLMCEIQKLSRKLLNALNQNTSHFKLGFIYSQRQWKDCIRDSTGGQWT